MFKILASWRHALERRSVCGNKNMLKPEFCMFTTFHVRKKHIQNVSYSIYLSNWPHFWIFFWYIYRKLWNRERLHVSNKDWKKCENSDLYLVKTGKNSNTILHGKSKKLNKRRASIPEFTVFSRSWNFTFSYL